MEGISKSITLVCKTLCGSSALANYPVIFCLNDYSRRVEGKSRYIDIESFKFKVVYNIFIT